ncbi:uncharacterized protein LOC129756826 [Uranotaenia lowii]|uniref:uncharacterized protein LOC129756826 n=1 Tax=Uranotaenia lowii TaxID=190385 RepID=UPI00247914C6|nr:uncharacterized protein LOC129756826 [Uranotaenia lowii]
MEDFHHRIPNEMWLEIFSHFDMASLINLSLVCKQWNSLIFTHFANRIQINFNLDLRPFPMAPGLLELGRPYKHLSVKSFKLDSPDALLKGIELLGKSLQSLKLELIVLEGPKFTTMLSHCLELQELTVNASYFECDRATPYVEALPKLRRLNYKVLNYVNTLDISCFDWLFFRTLSSVTEMDIQVAKPLDISLLTVMARKIRQLKVTLSSTAMNQFLSLKFPQMETLDLYLLHSEQRWRKRRTFGTESFKSFLCSMPKLRTSLFSLLCQYDQSLMNAIFSSLPSVEHLILAGGVGTERVSLSGLEHMKALKHLSLHCLQLAPEERRIVPMPSVQQFSLCTYIRPANFSEIVKRFPRLKTLAFRLHAGELLSVVEGATVLEELIIDTHRVTPEVMSHLSQMIQLKRLCLDAPTFARTNFRQLSKILTLPQMKRVDISTRSVIPPNIAGTVAASNPKCVLILNGSVIAPAVRVRRTGVKRKQSAPVVATPEIASNQSAAAESSNKDTTADSSAAIDSTIEHSATENSSLQLDESTCSACGGVNEPATTTTTNNQSVESGIGEISLEDLLEASSSRGFFDAAPPRCTSSPRKRKKSDGCASM